MRRFVLVVSYIAVLLLQASVLEAKTPAWLADEHPRLLATQAELAGLQAKLTTPGTPSSAIWSEFLTTYRKHVSFYDYADGAVLYWISGGTNTSAADQAIANAQDMMTTYPGGIIPSTQNLSDYPTQWWRYHNLLLTYDFAYGRLTPTQRNTFRDYIAREGELCSASGPSWAAGNIHMAFALCVLGSAIVLEGTDMSKDIHDEAIHRGSSANTPDSLSYPSDASAFTVSSGPGGTGTVYRENTDFIYRWTNQCSDPRCIDWSPSGAGTVEPGAGATYYVSYHWTANYPDWKNEGRRAFENHLAYDWRDGIYSGGLNPYGNLSAGYIPYFAEMLKRDLGIDYSKNDDIRKLVDPYIYERLPPGYQRWFNTINDTNSPGSNGLIYPTGGTYRTWMQSVVAWATKVWANDPEGYAQRAEWIWTKYYRTFSGGTFSLPDADWRTAFWLNDSLQASYPAPATPAITWPKHRYFRGKEVVYTRSSWSDTDTTATLASFVAGNHNYQNEHDQGDSGSFTFYSTGEDWAIDPGYQDSPASGGSLLDHNSTGIDGQGFAPTGIYAPPVNSYYNPEYGGFSHFDRVVLTDYASALKAELTGAWSLSSIPAVDHDQRYFAVITGDKAPYIVIADDIQKDNGTHTYDWYLHTGPNNVISLSAQHALITGSITGAKLDVYTLEPSGVSMSQAPGVAASYGAHQRLKISSAATVNPHFLHVLLPTASSLTAPTVVTAAILGGTRGTVTWPDGAVDLILWRHGSGTLSSSGIVSDAKLTIIRQRNSSVLGALMIDGRSVVLNGQSIIKVVDGIKPATVVAFGATAGVAGIDSSMIRLNLPFVTSALIEDGGVSATIAKNGNVEVINAPLPFDEMRRGAGVRYFEDFESGYAHNFYRYNKATDPNLFLIKNGALELNETALGGGEYPAIVRRDSTVWRRTHIFPTIIPPLEHGDAITSFRFRFSQNSSSQRKFRVYLRTHDRDPIDWEINQDYVRVEFNAKSGGVTANTVSVGQRINGNLSPPDGNDGITNAVASASAVIDNTSWHTVSVYLKGTTLRLTVDGNQLISATLPVAAPTAPASGYIQWFVSGSDPVLLDDVKVEAIDTTGPAAPTSGTISVSPAGTGSVAVSYDDGMSSDTEGLVVFESAASILPDTAVNTLSQIGTSNLTGSSTISGGHVNLYHAVAARDRSGNLSVLLPLSLDQKVPAAPSNLQVTSHP
jgi:hypothetical protein